jgi:FAD dependent oxidoreductase
MAALHIGIAGAGLLGRLLAWRLSGQGHVVTVLDPASGLLDRGQAAGWTAAGMLSPWAELECGNADVAALGLRSLDLWADIVRRLPQPVHFRRDGSLLLAHRSDLGVAQRLVGVLQARMPGGHTPRALTAEQLRELEPAVHGPTHAWLLEGEGQIHSVQAMRSLADAATRSGARWRWGCTVRELAPGRIDGERFDAVFDVRGVGARPDLPVRGEDEGFTPRVRGEDDGFTPRVRGEDDGCACCTRDRVSTWCHGRTTSWSWARARSNPKTARRSRCAACWACSARHTACCPNSMKRASCTPRPTCGRPCPTTCRTSRTGRGSCASTACFATAG